MTHTPHPWAVLDGDTPLFHVPGSYPPEYARDEALEALWRKGRTMGVPKKMPAIAAKSAHQHVHTVGIQSYRNGTVMPDKLKAPMPYVGGKTDMAAAIWARLGDTPNYVEVFCGSSAVLLARPHDLTGKTETCNDVDSFVVNAYRAIQLDPEETAYWCDWPVSESCLTSSHLWLKAQRPDLTERLFADPFYFDPIVAARWLWGAASWIGDGWCVADGPWINVDGRLVDRRLVGSDADGVTKQMPLVSARGDLEGTINQGVQSYRAAGVPRKMPEIGRSPNGQMPFNRKGVQAYRHHAGVPRKMPVLDNERYMPGMAHSALAAYFARLSDRLRRVRFLCGDWRRAVKDSVTVNHGVTGLFMDSPYPKTEHSMGYHTEEAVGDEDVWFQSARWAAEHGDDKRLRIAVCGYMSPVCDAMFPPTWERLPWEARGGYANQSKDGRGRTNAKREMIWFSPHCIDSKTDYGPLFAISENSD